MMVRYLSAREIEAAKGRTVEFAVIRDGNRVERSGTLGRVTPTVVWVGAYCYSRAEVIDTLRLPGGIPAGEDR